MVLYRAAGGLTNYFNKTKILLVSCFLGFLVIIFSFEGIIVEATLTELQEVKLIWLQRSDLEL